MSQPGQFSYSYFDFGPLPASVSYKTLSCKKNQCIHDTCQSDFLTPDSELLYVAQSVCQNECLFFVSNGMVGRRRQPTIASLVHFSWQLLTPKYSIYLDSYLFFKKSQKSKFNWKPIYVMDIHKRKRITWLHRFIIIQAISLFVMNTYE